ncbi:MAG: B12-binding domain-containing radical SAM protein [Coriobacteriia bacterium]
MDVKPQVLLINAPVRRTRSDWHAGLSLPLGLAYIGATLLQHHFGVRILDFNVSGFNALRLRRAIESQDPQILGISTHTETYLSGLEIARLAKEVKPSIKVVMGGPHASVTYEEVARQPEVDFVVKGEGEQTMLELARCLIDGSGELASIEGLIYEHDGDLRVNPPRPFVDDLDGLPLPARHLLPVDLYAYGANVLASRGGCPFACDFCAVNNIWHGRRRFRSPESIANEISVLINEFGRNEINFSDDTFTLSRDHTLALCKTLSELEVPGEWHWTCSTRVDLVDEELLRAMHDAGCSAVQFGAETGSQILLDSIGKRITLEQITSAVKIARSIGLEVLCSFMFPHPDDTAETVRMQIGFMKELVALGAKLSLSFTTPYPGTRYYDEAEELGINILASSWDEFDAKHLVIETRHLKADELQRLVREMVDEIGLDGGGTEYSATGAA